MSRPNLLLLEAITDEARAILSEAGTVVEADGNAHAVVAVVTRGKGRVDRALIDAHPGLRVIGRCGVGLDNIDVEYASERGIAVFNAPGVNADTVAEHTLALLLNLQRQIAAANDWARNDWNRRATYAGDEIRGKRIGIVGRGNIGRRFFRLAEALGMRAEYLDPRGEPERWYDYLTDLDVLSLHLPLTHASRGLIDGRVFNALPTGARLINTARAEIVNESDLLAALESGRLAGYACDVPSSGEATFDRIVAHPNTLATPHVASLTARTFNELCTLTARNVVGYLAGRRVDSFYHYNR